jgi:anti-sigma factor RsiW
MACPFNNHLSAYHDGELDAAGRAEIDRHLSTCPACASELAELTALSGLFQANPPPRLSQIAGHRLHNEADAVMQASFVRVARALQLVAACVLLAASLWPRSSETSNESVQSVPPWVDVAVTASAETNSLNVTTPAAAWYLADATARSEDAP